MESAVPNMGVRLPRGAFREARVDLLGTCRSPACPCLRPYWPNNMNNLLDNEVVCRQLRTLLQRLNIVVSYTDILAPNAFVYLDEPYPPRNPYVCIVYLDIPTD